MNEVKRLRIYYGLSEHQLVKRINSLYDYNITIDKLIKIEKDEESLDRNIGLILAEFFNVSVNSLLS